MEVFCEPAKSRKPFRGVADSSTRVLLNSSMPWAREGGIHALQLKTRQLEASELKSRQLEEAAIREDELRTQQLEDDAEQLEVGTQFLESSSVPSTVEGLSRRPALWAG